MHDKVEHLCGRLQALRYPGRGGGATVHDGAREKPSAAFRDQVHANTPRSRALAPNSDLDEGKQSSCQTQLSSML